MFMLKNRINFMADGTDAGCIGTPTQPASSPSTSPTQSTESSSASETTSTTNNNSNFVSNQTHDNGQEQQQPAYKEDGFHIVVDKVTGERELQFVQGTENAKPIETKDYVIPTTETATNSNALFSGSVENTQFPKAATASYNDQEFALALQLGTVDANRIPEQYKAPYQNMLTQRQQQSNVEQSAHGQSNEQTEEEKYKKTADFYSQIDKMAKQQAMQEIGITEDELVTAEYTDDSNLIDKVNQYKTAIDWNRQKIMQDVQQQISVERQAQAQQKAIYSDISTKVNEYKSKEPNFQKIDIYMESRYKSLPYAEAVEIANVINSFKNGSITQKQCQVLQKYYEDTRLDFYAKNVNLPTAPTGISTPAAVETPGIGATVQKAFDYKALGRADNRGKDELLATYFGFK